MRKRRNMCFSFLDQKFHSFSLSQIFVHIISSAHHDIFVFGAPGISWHPVTIFCPECASEHKHLKHKQSLTFYPISTMRLIPRRNKSSTKLSKSVKTHDVSAVYATSIKQVDSDISATIYGDGDAEPVLTAPAEETRDEQNPMVRFVGNASSAISNAVSGAVAEAANMASDVRKIIEADVPELEGDAPQDGKKNQSAQVKGGAERLAKLVKELGPMEKKMEQLGQEFVKAQEDVRKQREMIQYLSTKVNLEDGKKADDNDDHSDEGSVVSVVSHHVVDLGKRAESALFPHGDLSC